ncbi:hypothetical protein AURANDRAFT_72840, partial [Aureococcus anophagefferens]
MDDLAQLLDECTARSLVLVDELGRGTSAREGAAVGAAVLCEFRERGYTGVFATHLHEILDVLGDDAPATLKPWRMGAGGDGGAAFRVEAGVCTDSRALEAAARAGVPAGLVARAAAFLGRDAPVAEGAADPLAAAEAALGAGGPVLVVKRRVKRDRPPPPKLAARSCVYAFAASDVSGAPAVYVGETDALRGRLARHDATYGDRSPALVVALGDKSASRKLEAAVIRRLRRGGVPLLSTDDGAHGAALADWLAARGGACHPRVDLRRRRDDDVGGERSAVAAAPIAAGELLLRVPARCALRRDDEDALAAALDGILEDAEWAPYAATLPENPEVLDAWTRGERALLAGTGLAGAGGDHSKRRRMSARSARLVRSRAAQLDDGSWALVPGVDALNDGRGRAAPHCYDEFAHGGELLERYGFAPPGAAPAPRVFRVAELLDACGAAAPERLRAVAAALPDGLCAVVRGAAPPDALLSAVAALVASDDDFAAWEAAVDDGLAGGAPERDLWILDVEAAVAGDGAAAAAIAAALRRLASSALECYAADGAFDGFAGPAHRAASARRVRDDEVAACGELPRAVKGVAAAAIAAAAGVKEAVAWRPPPPPWLFGTATNAAKGELKDPCLKEVNLLRTDLFEKYKCPLLHDTQKGMDFWLRAGKPASSTAKAVEMLVDLLDVLSAARDVAFLFEHRVKVRKIKFYVSLFRGCERAPELAVAFGGAALSYANSSIIEELEE